MQGSPDVRYAAVRLAPSLADSQAQRAAFYPAVATARGSALLETAGQVPPTEESTLLQWAAYYRVLLQPLDDADAAAAAISRLQLPKHGG